MSISPTRPATVRAITPRSPPSRCRCCSSFPACTPIITSRAIPGTRSTRTGAVTLLKLVAEVTDAIAGIGRPAAIRTREGSGGPAWSRVSRRFFRQARAMDPTSAAFRISARFRAASNSPTCATARRRLRPDFAAGDILVEFDSKPIQNLYDFTYALRSKKPGDEVLVKVLRGNETISATVLLTKRVE